MANFLISKKTLSKFSIKIFLFFISTHTIAQKDLEFQIKNETEKFKELYNYFKAIDSIKIKEKNEIELFRANTERIIGITNTLLLLLEEYTKENGEKYSKLSSQNSENITKLNQEREKFKKDLEDLQNTNTDKLAKEFFKKFTEYFDEKNKLAETILNLKNSNQKLDTIIKSNQVQIKIKNETINNLKKTNDSLIISENVYKKVLAELNVNEIEWGISSTLFYNPQGEYYYEVKSDSTLNEMATGNLGGMISLVLYFCLSKRKKFESYGLVNLPFFEVSTLNKAQFFNKKSPLGLGVGFRFGESPMLISIMLNFSTTKRVVNYSRTVRKFNLEPGTILKLDDYTNIIHEPFRFFVNIGITMPLGKLTKAKKLGLNMEKGK